MLRSAQSCREQFDRSGSNLHGSDNLRGSESGQKDGDTFCGIYQLGTQDRGDHEPSSGFDSGCCLFWLENRPGADHRIGLGRRVNRLENVPEGESELDDAYPGFCQSGCQSRWVGHLAGTNNDDHPILPHDAHHIHGQRE